jgi:hypothetical protein
VGACHDVKQCVHDPASLSRECHTSHACVVAGCLDKDCSKIENTVNGVCNSYKSAGVGYCNCASGYYWSGKDVKCLSEWQTDACA